MKTEPAQGSRGLSPWIEWGKGELSFLGKREARKECEEILKSLLGVSRSELYLAPPPDPRVSPQFAAWVRARKERTPLAYLLEKLSFWEDEFEVKRGVFIPRPETETLVEAFLEKGGFSRNDSFYFLDLGTGTGNIAATIAKLFSHSRGVASDLSGRALTLTGRNAERLGVFGRLERVQSDGLLAFGKRAFDVVFSNPPYVARKEWQTLEPEVRQEPCEALVAGEDGLDFYRKIAGDLSSLKPGGSLWVEIGWDQEERVSALFEKLDFRRVEVFKDLNRIGRVIGGIGFHG